MFKDQELASILKASEVLKAMANPNRLGILCRLGERELSVNELVAEFNLSQSALSQHLAKLRDLNLVSTRRDQQMIYYRLDSPEVQTLIATLRSLYCKIKD